MGLASGGMDGHFHIHCDYFRDTMQRSIGADILGRDIHRVCFPHGSLGET
jgi:hypothetical protein